jgi:hypothetical protein
MKRPSQIVAAKIKENTDLSLSRISSLTKSVLSVAPKIRLLGPHERIAQF